MISPQFDLESGVSIGSYQLNRLLGRGGMGDVWLAADLRADRLVALKFIKPHLLDTPEFRNRFLNEARTLGRLEHDRIVTLYNVIEDGGYLALVLRFIEGATQGKGMSLADYIDERGALPLDFVLSSARDILPALGFAHDAGVIHRDIKPQNILLDRQPRSFLTDFGIAVVEFAERGTMTGSVIGTPHYMSPEQILDPRKISVQNKGHRSDIYSYGVVLYEMLTGRVPFCSDSGTEEIYKVQHAHCAEPPPPLRDVNPAISPDVEAVVLRCLAKNPDDRPQTCGELLKELNGAGSSPMPARTEISPMRAATVVERPRTGADASAEKAASAAPPPRQVAARRKQGVPRGAWLGIGGALIAAGISFTIWSSMHETVANGSGKNAIHVSDQSSRKTGGDASNNSGPSDAGAGRQGSPPVPHGGRTGLPGGVTTLRPANLLLGERAYTQAMDFSQRNRPCDAQTAIDEALRNDPSNAKYKVLKNELKESCAQQKSGAVEAEQDYQSAKQQYDEGHYCEGKSAIDEALKNAPGNAKYIDMQQRLAKGCALQ